jgi:hypothetical protein
MTPSNTPRPFGRITLRSIVLAALLAPVAAWVNISVEAIRYAGQPTTVSVYPHMMALLLLLVACSGAAGRVRPSWRLSPAEMVTIYFLVFMAAVMSAHDTMEVLVPILTYPFRYANAGNKWESTILPLLPRRLTVSDPSAVEHYWLGGADLWRSGEVGVWLGPALCWAAFLSALVFCGACLNSLLRRQWAENERLAFPLAQLPLDLVQPRQPLWTNRLFLMGFAAAVAHDTWFGLHTLWPTIPEPYIRFQTAQQFLTAPPWNAIAWLPVAFFPWIMGLGVMLPTDLLFSCWFFFIIWKLQPVVAAANGYTDIPGFPFVFEQSFGAYMAIAVFNALHRPEGALAGLLGALDAGRGGHGRRPAPPEDGLAGRAGGSGSGALVPDEDGHGGVGGLRHAVHQPHGCHRHHPAPRGDGHAGPRPGPDGPHAPAPADVR